MVLIDYIWLPGCCDCEVDRSHLKGLEMGAIEQKNKSHDEIFGLALEGKVNSIWCRTQMRDHLP